MRAPLLAVLCLATAARADAPAFELDGNVLKVPAPIVYETGAAKLAPASDAALAHVAAYLAAKTYVSALRVEVHADASGDRAAAQALTEQRALAVARALVGRGVDCHRLVPVGFGATKPVADNATAEGRAQNRRTLFVNAALRGRARERFLVDRLAATRAHSSRLGVRGSQPGSSAAHLQELDELARRDRRIEASISRRSIELQLDRPPVALEQVQAAIPDGAALIDEATVRLDAGQDAELLLDTALTLETTTLADVANLLGGEIGLEDNPGGGSHFWAELPMQVPQAPSAAEDQSTVVSFEDPFLRHKARVRPVHVLVADDQAANRKVLCRMLERAGHRVSEADDGEQALDRIAEGGIDIAIIDMHMPRVTGLDVLKQLRFMQAGSKRTPVIVFSADATPQALRDAEEAGAHAFLTKPVVVARLLEAVASLLDGRKLTTTKPAAEGVRPMVNPVVLQELAEMNLGGAFLRDFVEQCLADANQCVIEMNRLHSLQDWREFREMAHALKGVAENLGAQMLADRCSQVMRASDEALRREASVLIRDITVQLGSAAEQTRAEAARLSAGTGKPDADAGPERSPGPDKG